MAANDIKAAEKTYEGFMVMLKWSVPVVVAVVVLVMILIT